MNQIKVECIWGACPEFGKQVDVDPGVLQGDGKVLSLFAGHACTECGMTMNLVQE